MTTLQAKFFTKNRLRGGIACSHNMCEDRIDCEILSTCLEDQESMLNRETVDLD